MERWRFSFPLTSFPHAHAASVGQASAAVGKGFFFSLLTPLFHAILESFFFLFLSSDGITVYPALAGNEESSLQINSFFCCNSFQLSCYKSITFPVTSCSSWHICFKSVWWLNPVSSYHKCPNCLFILAFFSDKKNKTSNWNKRKAIAQRTF